MAEFYGKLTVGQIYSFLETHSFPHSPRKYWLLFRYDDAWEDMDDAGSAATSYIVGTKHLASGSPVIVTGEMVTIDSVPLINMSDINAADIEMATAHFEALSLRRGRVKKTGAAKKKTRARKHASKSPRPQKEEK